MSGTSISVFGELSKPATVLVEKISDAVGGVFRPVQIVRVARAEAQARVIHAEADIAISELEQRAFARFREEETRKQHNMESITQQALPLLDERAIPQNVEDDWIAHFFDKCRLVSDSEMQVLWARVLAGEANKPGRFSKRTVDIIASLDKRDATLFTTLCAFACTLGGDSDLPDPLVYEIEDDVYKEEGLDFAGLNHLASIGLITTHPVIGYSLIEPPLPMPVSYFDQVTTLSHPLGRLDELEGGIVLFSQAGREIASICRPARVPAFLSYLQAKWHGMGLVVDPWHIRADGIPNPVPCSADL